MNKNRFEIQLVGGQWMIFEGETAIAIMTKEGEKWTAVIAHALEQWVSPKEEVQSINIKDLVKCEQCGNLTEKLYKGICHRCYDQHPEHDANNYIVPFDILTENQKEPTQQDYLNHLEEQKEIAHMGEENYSGPKEEFDPLADNIIREHECGNWIDTSIDDDSLPFNLEKDDIAPPF